MWLTPSLKISIHIQAIESNDPSVSTKDSKNRNSSKKLEIPRGKKVIERMVKIYFIGQ